MELHGAVFLPAAGYRNGTSVDSVGSYGNYWSASYDNSGNAYDVYFNDSNLYPQYYNNRYYGFSVRLARVAENCSLCFLVETVPVCRLYVFVG